MVGVCLLMLSGMLSAQGNSDNAFERVKEVQERHTNELMAKAGVVGTAVGLNDRGRTAVLVLLEEAGVGGIPQQLEGVPVHPIVTGKIYAMPKPSGAGGTTLSPTSTWPRPVPIGVSTGNEGECSSGTIGCRVHGAGGTYALSNNHVYALENHAGTGSKVLQPGRYDTGCSTSAANVIGTLSNYVAINFGGTNKVDAAIALTDTGKVGTATPPDGYGQPSKTPSAASVGMAVKKYGRTTGLTHGTVTGLNATITVGYSSGSATFTDQIIVQSRKPVIKAGDSGSLLVTESGEQPVGLLFAGDSTGKYAVANQIANVLNAFGVTIDGK